MFGLYLLKSQSLGKECSYIICLFFCVLLWGGDAMGQVMSRRDSINFNELHLTNSKFINNVFRQAVNSAKKTPDGEPDDNYQSGKSEDPYLRYQGKIIRHIFIEPVNFDRNFADTSKRDNSLGARIGKRLHYTTKKFVIRDNLFIKEGTPLNAYMVADNERYLRTREYIQDARIVVRKIKGNKDSVDLVVFTRDLFSIAGGASSEVLNHINANVYESNLGGMAQRLELSGLYDYNRKPEWGYGGLFRKGNVLHSFIDATIAYSTMNISSFTHEEETTRSLSLSKQLVSPYTRMAGALTLSHNNANNVYKLPDYLFYKYSYDLFDAWAGYSIGIRQLTATNNGIRDRRFLAIRLTDRKFNDVPAQVGQHYDPIFNTTRSALAQFTFFRQDYYKTQYIYGFGTTEDYPYGYNISVTLGWHEQLDLQRPYAGLKVSEYIATKKNDLIQLYLRTGGFLYKDKVQDGSFLIGATAFSRLYFWNSTKIRQYINMSYTHLYNRVTYAPLRLDNSYGLRGFLSDSIYGTRRLSVQLETEFYLKPKLWGFKFAPFPYADLSLITPEKGPYSHSSLFTSVGGGIRARNENLVFNTMELRAYYFPIAPTNMKGFKVILTTNIRFRYSSNYITAPDVVQLNGD